MAGARKSESHQCNTQFPQKKQLAKVDTAMGPKPGAWHRLCANVLIYRYKSRIQLNNSATCFFFNLTIDHEDPYRSLHKDLTLRFSSYFYTYVYTHTHKDFYISGSISFLYNVCSPSSRIFQMELRNQMQLSLLNGGLANLTLSWLLEVGTSGSTVTLFWMKRMTPLTFGLCPWSPTWLTLSLLSSVTSIPPTLLEVSAYPKFATGPQFHFELPPLIEAPTGFLGSSLQIRCLYPVSIISTIATWAECPPRPQMNIFSTVYFPR